ncbi:hypothetical protein MTX78_03795 [Hymenobacter tibetensis]|uniref:Uncharacterized protein n=1 Tax=Hymenobacter tibetensis TaxID=497967 RepID=A0ABY4D0C9_9BACT|nr:hypothetical protein [Hymenobacter tibetensis]UOG75722.1 hypothetical protein MTX78_03795 [Hymenobacter tibetensis]
MNKELLGATIHALQNGLTSIPISGALDNTETWQQHLLQSGEPALQDVGREIGNLQSLLSGGNLDPEAISSSLSILGSQTNQAAVNASPDFQAQLRTLGDLLLQLSTKLKAA